MITQINYSAIKDLIPKDAYELLNGIEKSAVKDARIKDLINLDQLDVPIHEFSDISSRGIYLFFDRDGNAVYIGQTNANFLERLTTQLDITEYKGFGWNSMLRILGGLRTGMAHDDLTWKDHEIDRDDVLEGKLLLIEVDRTESITADNIRWIEKVLLKTFREIELDLNKLINGNVGWLKPEWWNMTISEIIES